MEPDPVIDRAAAMMREESYGRAEARQALLAKLASVPAGPPAATRRRPSWGRAASATLGLAMAAAAILLIVRDGARRDAAQDGDSGPAPSRVVQFSVAAPAARRVTLVGEFNDWNDRATPMRRVANGRWTTAVSLSPGRHLYSFEIDGEGLVSDPLAPVAPESPFGVRHSVVVVPGSGY
jgi:hypothetical protein